MDRAVAVMLVFSAVALTAACETEGTTGGPPIGPAAPPASPTMGGVTSPMTAGTAAPSAVAPSDGLPTAGGAAPGVDASNAPAADAGTTPADAAAPPVLADAGQEPAVDSEPILPPIDDPARAGPVGVERQDRVDGLATHSLFVPDATGTHGKHPVVVWTNGNGGSLSTLGYASFVEHLASHGFLVLADKASNGTREAEVDSQAAAIAWALAENERAGGPFFERIDSERIAVMGHSLGSLASFATASNEHVTTSVHFSGGITDNPVGFDPSWLQQMRRPAAFLCGGADATAGPSCAKDFAMAPVPVFYGVLERASHIGPFVSARGGEYGRAAVAWLRWQLAGDAEFRAWFVGSDCVLCSDPWSAMQRDLE